VDERPCLQPQKFSEQRLQQSNTRIRSVGASGCRRWSDLPRPFLLTLATLFAGAGNPLWLAVDVQRSPVSLVELGFDNQYNAGANAEDVLSVIPGSRQRVPDCGANDRIVAVNGLPLDPTAPLEETWMRARPGDPVDLTVERPGEHKPLLLRGLLSSRVAVSIPGGSGQEFRSGDHPIVSSRFPCSRTDGAVPAAR